MGNAFLFRGIVGVATAFVVAAGATTATAEALHEVTPSLTNRTRVKVKGGTVQTAMDAGHPVIKSFKGGFAGGKFAVEGMIQPTRTQRQSARIHFNDVDATKALKELFPQIAGFISGRLSGSADLNWTGNITGMGDSISGDGKLIVRNGRLSGAKIEEQLKKLGLDTEKEIEFSEARIDFTAADGDITVKRLEVAGEKFSLSADGNIDLRNDELALTTRLHLAKELAAQTPYAVADKVMSFFGTKEEPKNANGFVAMPEYLLVKSWGKKGREVAEAKEVASRDAAVKRSLGAIAAATETE